MDLKTYARASRAPRYSVLFALPLLLLYEVLAWGMQGDSAGFRNGADVLLKSLFLAVGGSRGLLVFSLVLAGAGLWLVARDQRRHPGPLRPGIFLAMLAESLALGVVVGVVVGWLTSVVLHPLRVGAGEASFAELVMLSLGAGLYEELMFRVLLVGALAWIASRWLRWTPRRSGVIACLVGAVLFSAFHYIGPYAYPLELQSFVFRAIAGVVFSAIYLTRGFGIAAWTHALYDILVTILPS